MALMLGLRVLERLLPWHHPHSWFSAVDSRDSYQAMPFGLELYGGPFQGFMPYAAQLMPYAAQLKCSLATARHSLSCQLLRFQVRGWKGRKTSQDGPRLVAHLDNHRFRTPKEVNDGGEDSAAAEAGG